MPCGGHGIKTQKLHCATVCQAGKYPGWWFQPVWKRCSSNWKSSPTFRGEKWQNRWNHHLDWLCNYLVGGFNPSEKYALQIGSFPQVGLEIKNIWVATTQLWTHTVLLTILLPQTAHLSVDFFFLPGSRIDGWLGILQALQQGLGVQVPSGWSLLVNS